MGLSARFSAVLLPLLLGSHICFAQDAGSTAFCLFPLPAENSMQRSINLGIVQYVELRPDEVRISYGGGNLGSGHEARIPIKNREEGDAVLARLRRSAAQCARSSSPLSGDKS